MTAALERDATEGTRPRGVLDRMLPAFEAYLRRDPGTRAKFKAVEELAWKREKAVHPALDVSTMVRVAQRIGVDRVPRDVVPCLAEYLHQGRQVNPSPTPDASNDDLSTRLPQAQETEP